MNNEDLLGQHFNAREFRCHCGRCALGFEAMRPELLRALVVARRIANTPFVLTSTIRCPQHNADVGGVDSSAHVNGYAVDIAANTGSRRHQIMVSAMDAGFTRIGIAAHFIHVDCDPSKPANLIWTY